MLSPEMELYTAVVTSAPETTPYETAGERLKRMVEPIGQSSAEVCRPIHRLLHPYHRKFGLPYRARRAERRAGKTSGKVKTIPSHLQKQPEKCQYYECVSPAVVKFS